MDAPVEISRFSEETLFASLANERFPETEVRSHNGAKYLYGYLKDLDAKTIVLEKDYTDRDYLDDFSAYYVKCFRDYERRCARLHFFSSELGADDFNKVVDATGDGEGISEKEEELRNSYLGFSVVRPLPSAIIGRTILKTYQSEGTSREYPCWRKYRVNLCGIDLTVRSLAFQEQDTVMAACATVSLWCSFHKLATLFGTACPTPTEITRAANTLIHADRPIPSHGLIAEQICNAIRWVGLEPEVVRVGEVTPVVSLIYGHLRMGLPVILGVQVEGQGLHAITLCGYSLTSARARGVEKLAVPLTGLRIDQFYGHDDQFGPFSRLQIKPSATVDKRVYPVVFEGCWEDHSTGKRLTLYPEVLIIPVYHKIRIRFLEVQEWLVKFAPLVRLVIQDGDEFEWDVHLIINNDYKRELRRASLPSSVRGDLLRKHHPRYIWRAILRKDGMKLMELLADATDLGRAFPVYEAVFWNNSFRAGLRTHLRDKTLQSRLESLLSKGFYEFLYEKIS